MNQTRSFLLLAWLAAAAWLLMEWNRAPDAAAHASPATTLAAQVQAPSAVAAPLPGAAAAPVDSGGNAAVAAPLPAGGSNAPAIAASSPTAGARTITLSNDRLRLLIDLDGGRVLSAQLLQYTVEKKPGSPQVQLLDADAARYYVADAGLIAVEGQAQRELPLSFQSERGNYELAAGALAATASLQATDPATGLGVLRTLGLRRGSYVLELHDAVANGGAKPQQLYPFVRLSRVAPPAPPKHSFVTNPDSFSFVGAAWYTPEQHFQKAPFKDYTDETPPEGDTAGGWIAMLQHHFVSAWVPSENEKQRLQASVSSHEGLPLYNLRSIAAPLALAPGAQATHDSRLWVGPKLQAPMAALAPSLTISVDYGRLSFISRPLFWLLEHLHELLGNWGWSIIAIVVILKALLYWPSKKQYQSMAKMRAVQPRIEALKERYGDDKQALNVAMFELYKKEKVNPAAGCWPMLIQMPIFLGLYWVLIETVELRHAAWFGWIQNLTAPDPYFVLPALNLLVMFLTQRLTPTPGMDPMQKKMMQTMPLVFGVMMAFFPAGLVLYWVTNGGLGLLQQWWMLQKYGPQKPAATGTISR
jgi:YidC/Oxa1 family membrane protein insertase